MVGKRKKDRRKNRKRIPRIRNPWTRAEADRIHESLKGDLESSGAMHTCQEEARIHDLYNRCPFYVGLVSSGMRKVRSAPHAIGVKRAVEMLSLHGAYGVAGLDRFNATDDQRAKLMLGVNLRLYEVVRGAQVYLVRTKISESIFEAPSLPDHEITEDDLPFDPMLLVHEDWSASELKEEGATLDPEGPLTWGQWSLVFTDRDLKTGKPLLRIMSEEVPEDLARGGHNNANVRSNSIELNRMFPRDHPSGKAEEFEWLLKLLHFIRTSKRISTTTRTVRSSQGGDVGSTPQDPLDVTIVELRRTRRPDDDSSPDTPKGDGAKRATHHHWWVGGHWRNQWYPSEKRHRPKWIDPYLKGDVEKPLLEKVYDVRR